MKYIDYIKRLPCEICETDPPSDPHHLIGDGFGTMGGKSPDVLLMPLCRFHHNQVHKMTRAEWNLLVQITQEEMLSRTLRRATLDGWEMKHGG